ncbi:hypothetical protein [Pseudomonas sp. 21]|uniref:hypothetical protein n=1 Tax=Pseudomonas sp. 21 TaxID=1619948 RepID=UPI000B0794D3|nr:hypothetical protein [Pseudomonas sp. 21]
MNKDVAQVIVKLLGKLHEASSKAFALHASLSGCRKFMEDYAEAHDSQIFFSGEHTYALNAKLINFLTKKKKGSETPYYLVDLEPSEGWIKLLRLVVTKHEHINAEVVYLKSDEGGDKSFGFRYEHPEVFPKGTPGYDKHAFFHVQQIKRTTINGVDIELPGSIEWFPTSTPTFFMLANCDHELILYAIHSACGWEPLEDLRVESFAHRRFLLRSDDAFLEYSASI